MGTLACIKIILYSGVIPCISIQIFLGKLRKENQKGNLVAILFITNTFDRLLLIKNNKTTTQLSFIRDGLCSVFRGAYLI